MNISDAITKLEIGARVVDDRGSGIVERRRKKSRLDSAEKKITISAYA